VLLLEVLLVKTLQVEEEAVEAVCRIGRQPLPLVPLGQRCRRLDALGGGLGEIAEIDRPQHHAEVVVGRAFEQRVQQDEHADAQLCERHVVATIEALLVDEPLENADELRLQQQRRVAIGRVALQQLGQQLHRLDRLVDVVGIELRLQREEKEVDLQRREQARGEG
jgi:hypothetical protein